MTIERCLCGSIKVWRTSYFSSKKALIVSVAIWIVLLCIIVPMGALISYEGMENQSLTFYFNNPIYIMLMTVGLTCLVNSLVDILNPNLLYHDRKTT